MKLACEKLSQIFHCCSLKNKPESINIEFMALFDTPTPSWPTFLNQADTGVTFNIPPNWQLAQTKGDSCIFITGDTKAVLTIIRKSK